MYYYLKKICASLLTFLELQLFILLISWPICLWWGIPLNLTSIAGNLIMSPAIIVVLGLCSLITAGILCGFECNWLCICLEQCVTYWYWILERAPQLPLVVCATPHPLFLVLLIIVPCGMIMYLKNSYKKIILFIVYGMSMYGVLKVIEPKQVTRVYRYANHLFIFVKQASKTCLIDFGKSRQIRYNRNLIKRLLPEWYKTMGTTSISHVVLLKTSPSVDDFYEQLSKKIKICTLLKKGPRTGPL